MSDVAFKAYDCVTFLDETGCRRVGDIASIDHDRHKADVRVLGWREVFEVDLSDLAPHAQPGSR